MRTSLLNCFALFSLLAACTKEKTPAATMPMPTIERWEWETAIAGYAGEYFSQIYQASPTTMFVPVWKGWNGGGTTQPPTTMFTTDGGATWQTIGDNSGLPRTWTYVQKVGQTYWAGTPNEGLFRSDNGGITWQKNTSVDWQRIWTIQSDGRNLIVSDINNDKTYLTKDNGQSWSMIYPQFLRVIEMQGQSVYATRRGVVLSTNDLGVTWQADSSLLQQVGTEQSSVGLVLLNEVLYLGTSSGVYKRAISSTGKWQKISELTRELGFMYQSKGVLFIQEAHTNRIFYSSNKGESWKQFGQGIIEGRIFGMAQSGKFLFASGEDGFFKRQIED